VWTVLLAVAAVVAVTGAAGAQTPGAPSSPPQNLIPPFRDSRLFIGPTARALKAGDGYFVLHGAVAPAFQIGLTDRISFGAGSFLFVNGNFFVTPKVQFVRRGSTSMSAALIHVVVPNEGHLGLAFVSATRDTARGGWTVGLGAAYSDGWEENDDWAVAGPLVMVGADRQLTRRVAFVSENYIVFEGAGLLFNGARAVWGRFSLDAALMLAVGSEGAVGAPFLNLAWQF
jgi:hypothetical protein